MSDRRSLTEGLKATPPPVDTTKEKAFVFGGKDQGNPANSAVVNRVPLSTRIRADMFAALKRASLERQLSGREPHTIIEIIEEAIEPWLRANGYLP